MIQVKKWGLCRVGVTRQVSTARDTQGNIIATVTDYYDKYVHPLGDKYRKTSFTKDRTVICPFHDDNNPSLGLIRDRSIRDLEIFHCFACGASGDVVRMHRRIVQITEGRVISLENATKELAKLYGITYSESEYRDQVNTLLERREFAVDQMIGKYNFRTHSQNLLKIRQSQDKLTHEELAHNIDVVLTKWKKVIKHE